MATEQSDQGGFEFSTFSAEHLDQLPKLGGVAVDEIDFDYPLDDELDNEEITVVPIGIGTDLEDPESADDWEAIDEPADQIDDDLIVASRRAGRVALRLRGTPQQKRRRKPRSPALPDDMVGFPDPLPALVHPDHEHIDMWGPQGYLGGQMYRGDVSSPAETTIPLSARYTKAINAQLVDDYLTSLSGPSAKELSAVEIDDLENAETWEEFANCKATDTNLFFPERGASSKEGKAVCSDCVVREQCLEESLSRYDTHGIWGGTSDRQRRRIKEQRAILRAQQAQRDRS